MGHPFLQQESMGGTLPMTLVRSQGFTRLVCHGQGFPPLPLSYASRQGRCLLLDGMERHQTYSSRWILCWIEFIAILGTIEPISPVNSRFQDCDVSVMPYELN